MRRSGCEAYVDELTRIAARDRRVVCLAGKADGRGHPFELAHADRFFDLNGVEAAMASMARGLAVAGFRQFVCVRPGQGFRPMEQLRAVRAFLAAGATVVTPAARWDEAETVLRGLPDISFAVPCGEEETRAVIREAARTGRPHYIRVGAEVTAWTGAVGRPGGPPDDGRPSPLVHDDPPYGTPEGTGPAAGTEAGAGTEAPGGEPTCLVSVGERGTALAASLVRMPGARRAHAHLVYLGDEDLAVAAAALTERRHRQFALVGAVGEVDVDGLAAALARLLPGRRVTGVPLPAGAGAGAGAEVEAEAGAVPGAGEESGAGGEECGAGGERGADDGAVRAVLAVLAGLEAPDAGA
ncbi:transketolase [Streptomyces sp. NPDC012421]|uniref:transketolase n=1 Tax=Streptomyces sp. NPDC012421 TaxID=3364832 RepID=UPI0036E8243D